MKLGFLSVNKMCKDYSLIDAHFHADDLYEQYPLFLNEYLQHNVCGIASVHTYQGYLLTKKIMSSAKHFISFGLHPQNALMDEAQTLALLANNAEIDAIGECGFDFFGDRAGTIRNAHNVLIQKQVFEFQLNLAKLYNLPIVLHLRKANDLLFFYAKELSSLPAVILHSWPGPQNDALSFLRLCPNAFFSFGMQVLRKNKKVRDSLFALPLSNILTETDAPYQPMYGAQFSRHSDLVALLNEIAIIHNIDYKQVADTVASNFARVFAI